MLKIEDILNAIHIAQSRYIESLPAETIFNGLLADLLAVTQSEYGFIGEVLLRDEDVRYLKTRAITNIAWNEETRTFYDENAPLGLEFYNLKSLFGEVVVTEECVISNNPSEDPRGCGIPVGHPDLNAFLGIPFFFNDKLVGMAGIANRSDGYCEEIITDLKPFTATCANIIMADRGLREKSRIEEQKNEFVSIVSHELKTPITSIQGGLSLLKKNFSDEISLDKSEALDILDIAVGNCNRMTKLIRDLLDFNKMERHNVPFNLKTHTLDELIKSSVSNFISRKISTNFECDPAVTICADQDRFLQVINNLLDNAIKYSDKDIKVNIRDTAESIYIDVIDEGIGISKDNLKNLFMSFYQVDSSDSRSFSGIGLGLSICQILLREM
ncbi:MAG: GAF domain-containing sensor histidine kinase, partial [Bacteriovoracaceae bacterium]|nr:GAF domain-containing sensor histidine kinase [Bacteriovoracaceae bacterium]